MTTDEKDTLEITSASSPFFSVVMPVYNGQTYLVKAIESVLAQTDADWEFVIIDDCSQDQTPQILATYASKDKRIRIISNEQNIRVAKSLNRGISSAKGKWIVRLDADDIFTTNYLKTLRSYVEAAEFDCIFSTWVTVIDEMDQKILDIRLPSADTIRRMMKIENFLYHPATSFSKVLWEKVGKYPDENPKISEDTAMWNRCFSFNAKLIMVPEFLVNYRLHYSNMTVIKDGHFPPHSREAASWEKKHQNLEWRISLYLKQGMLTSARTAILAMGKTQKSLSLKNIQYLTLTYLPKNFVYFFMWKFRPYIRAFYKKLKGIA